MKPGSDTRLRRAFGTQVFHPGSSRPPVWVLLAMLMLTAAAAPTAADTRSMEQQLARMAAALRSLSYEGILVYAHDSRLETLRIVRRVKDGQVHELLESLNGPVRMVTREEDQVTCHLANESPILVRSQGLGSDLLRPKALDPEALAPHYVVHPLGEARVAGRQTDVVGIIPRDALRYGYRFYLDLDSGLPLKSDLMGTEAKPIEQIVFTSLTLHPAAIPDSDLSRAKARPLLHPTAPQQTGPWRFEGMPAGFELVMADRSASAAGSNAEHYVFSDGLASVSVYIEPGVEDGLQGESRIGAVHAAGARISDHQVTVVGEVPAVTVQSVLDGIVREPGAGE